MVKITVNFFWQNQEVLSQSIELESPIIGASNLIEFFQKNWSIDTNDYTLRDILIAGTDIKVHLKSLEDFRQIQLYKINF